MKLIFKKLELLNFKGMRDNTFTFLNDVNSFYGRNETGKSTIADAISWVLFGKDSHDNQKFGIKTYDKNREPIPHLKHYAILTIAIDGEEHTLKRELSENWSKDGNTLTGNETLYTVDGMNYTATDYKAFINNIINEGTFKAVTNPTYFLNLSWQDQRKVLADLAGKLKDEDITKGDPKFSELLGLLQRQSMEDILKHLHYQLKKVEDKLKLIPVRLKEQQKALPEKLNWDKVYLDLEESKKKVKEAQGKLNQVSQGNTEDVVRDELRKKMDELQDKVDTLVEGCRSKVSSLQDAHDVKVRTIKKALDDAKDTYKSIGGKINDLNLYILKTKDSFKQLEEDKARIQKEWNDNKAKTVPDIPEGISVCPTCGQELPADQLKEKILELKERFNKHRAEEAKVIRAKFSDVKEQLEKANSDLVDYQKEWTDAQDKYSKYKKVVAEKEKEYADATKESVVTLNDLLAEDKDYKVVVDSLTKAKDNYNNHHSPSVDTELVDRLQKEYDEAYGEYEKLSAQYAAKAQYDKIQQNIDDINKEKDSLDKQWNSLNEQNDIALEYQSSHDNLLESKVNGYFSYVNFRMFRRLVNGSKEPYCECFRIKDGVPYYDLNSAGKLNAGIDIINTFQKRYQIFAPVVIDNAEATNKILKTQCQQIRFYVSEDKVLTKRLPKAVQGQLFN